jgi:hypothetical protein
MDSTDSIEIETARFADGRYVTWMIGGTPIKVSMRASLLSGTFRDALQEDDDEDASAAEKEGNWGTFVIPPVSDITRVDKATGANETISIPLKVRETAIAKIAEWCEHHVDNPMPKIPHPIPSKIDTMGGVLPESQWDVDFIEGLFKAPYEVFFDLLATAHYLGIDALEVLGSAQLALCIRSKTPEQIRECFDIPEPTEDEEDKIRADNEWIFAPRTAAP